MLRCKGCIFFLLFTCLCTVKISTVKPVAQALHFVGADKNVLPFIGVGSYVTETHVTPRKTIDFITKATVQFSYAPNEDYYTVPSKPTGTLVAHYTSALIAPIQHENTIRLFSSPLNFSTLSHSLVFATPA